MHQPSYTNAEISAGFPPQFGSSLDVSKNIVRSAPRCRIAKSPNSINLRPLRNSLVFLLALIAQLLNPAEIPAGIPGGIPQIPGRLQKSLVKCPSVPAPQARWWFGLQALKIKTCCKKSTLIP